MTSHKKLVRLDLTLKVSILIIVIVLSTSIVLNLVFRDFFKKYGMDGTHQHIMFFSRTEGIHYGHHILDGNIKMIHKHILDNISAYKNINDIHVYDRDGYLLVDSSGLKRERPTDKWIQKCLRSRTMVDRFEGYLFRHFEPMTVDGEVVGFLYIEFNADFLPIVMAKGRNFFIYITGILILIFVSIGVVISKRLISPLIDIAEASKRVADGDLSVSVPVKAKDERGILSENFNLMVNRLREAQAEITNYARNLEQVVELRTERLNSALKELQEGKEFIERIFSTVGALIVVLNAEGRIVMFNRECEDVTGFGEDEVKGNYVWDFLLPERFITPVRAVFADLTNQKLPNSFENPWMTKDGRERNILWNNTIITDENGQIRYVIGTGIDITEKKLMEEYLMESQRLRSIATLVTGLSHNFNNILVGVLGYAGLLKVKIASGDITDAAKYIGIIENSAEKASDLIKHLMLFSKKAEYEVREISLNDVVNDVLKIITHSFLPSISIKANLQEVLYKINADRDNVQQVILNICLNARDAMPEGGALEIETFNEEVSEDILPVKKGRYAVIRISDTGCGMDEETKARMYEPFFTTKGLLDHLGMGLSIAYSIIKDHNGHISVDTKIGRGTTFKIYLPAA